MSTIDINLEIEGFRDWLTSQPDDATVGYAQEAFACPLANYLTAQLRDERGRGYARVGSEYATLTPPARVAMARDILLPEWAQAFVAAVDEAGSPIVTKEQALALVVDY